MDQRPKKAKGCPCASKFIDRCRAIPDTQVPPKFSTKFSSITSCTNFFFAYFALFVYMLTFPLKACPLTNTRHI